MDTNSQLKIAVAGLSAALLLVVGILVGMAIGRGGSSSSEKVKTSKKAAIEAEAQAEEEVVVEEKKVEEKTYGYYPSFYMKNIYFLVSAEEGDHSVYVYTDGITKVVDANTNCRWLEESKLGKGGTTFHVKKNKDGKKRVGQLYLYDNKGRKITVYVTQRG